MASVWKLASLGLNFFWHTENWHGRNIFLGCKVWEFSTNCPSSKKSNHSPGGGEHFMWHFILFFLFWKQKTVVFKNSRIPKSTFFFGPPNEYISTKPCHQKNHGVFRKPAFCDFFSYWKGGPVPVDPLKFRSGGHVGSFFPGGDLFVFGGWVFFPKISGSMDSTRPWGRHLCLGCVRSFGGIGLQGGMMGRVWGGWRWGRMAGEDGVLSFFFLHFFRFFFWGFLGGGDEKKTQNGIFWWKDECSSFFFEDIIWGRSSRKDKGKR